MTLIYLIGIVVILLNIIRYTTGIITYNFRGVNSTSAIIFANCSRSRIPTLV